MAIYYESYIHDQLKEYINGRESVKSMCDFTILNFNWPVTAVIMDTRLGFFYFEETSPGLVRIMDYGELGLQDISKIERNNSGKTFTCSLHSRDGRLDLESIHKDDADQFIDLLSKVTVGASGFQRWILELNKHGMDLSSYIFWAITGKVKINPGSINKKMPRLKIIGFSGIGILFLGLLTDNGIIFMIGLILTIFGAISFFKGKKLKCPSCKTFYGLQNIDNRIVTENTSSQVFNIYRYCLNCGLKVIGSQTLIKK